MSKPPTIDISALFATSDKRGSAPPVATAARISNACRDIGFLVVTGHGIPGRLIDQMRRLTKALFEQALDKDHALRITPENYRGHIPLNFFTPNASGDQADGYEGYKLHEEVDAADPIRTECSLYGPNKWPDGLPELRDAIRTYWRHCDRVAHTLLRVLIEQLQVDPAFLQTAFSYPLTNMTLLHYPGVTSTQTASGIHPHKDTDVLTILAPDPVGGLELRTRHSDQWIPVTAPADGLIVNIGDMLELWSGGHYVSTPHRVLHASAQDRYSFPYFMVPRYDVDVAPLCEPVPGFDRVPMNAGDVSRKIWQSNWPNSSPVETCYDPAVE